MKDVTLPNGTTVSVPMWGYALDRPSTPAQRPTADGVLNAGEDVTVPGPRITVPAGDTTLTIRLTNLLPEADLAGHPRTAVRRASAREERRRPRHGDDAGDAARRHPGLRLHGPEAGHVPVPERLAPRRAGADGPLRRDDEGRRPPATAYAGIAYAHEARPALQRNRPGAAPGRLPEHRRRAFSPGTYGTPAGPTSTIDYRPSLFLINGESYTNEAMATIAAGTAGRGDAAAPAERRPSHARPGARQRQPADRGRGRQHAAVREGPGDGDAGRRQDARRALDARGRGRATACTTAPSG